MWKKALNIFFPKICLYCHTQADFLFCDSCACLFDWINPQEHCPYCFENQCQCQKKQLNEEWSKIHIKKAAALENCPEVAAFVRYVEKGFFLHTAAAFLIIQFLRLGWPWPDWIVPKRSRLFSQHTFFLSYAFGEILGVPIYNKWRYLKRQMDKKFLIIDVHFQDDASLENKINQLLDLQPSGIFALTLCKSAS